MITKNEMSKHVGNIGYDILDNIVGPVCGISGIFADLYLADIETYTYEDKEQKKIFKLISKKYEVNINWGIFCNKPIALIALYIMEEGNYFENFYKPRKLKIKDARNEIAKYILEKKKKKITKMSAWKISDDLKLPIQQVEKILEKWEEEKRIKSI